MSDNERAYSEDDNMMIDDEETALELAALQADSMLPQRKKEFINHKAALSTLVDEISQKDLDWIQRCDITNMDPLVVENTEDDLDRELKFYQQALEAVTEAKDKIKKAGVPFSRPNDYFAEMVKSDSQMARIRQKLLDQKKSIQNAEEAKKQRQLRKYGKQIQQEKIKEREDKKKATLDKIAAVKKRLRNGNAGDDNDEDFDINVDSDDNSKSGSAFAKKDKNGRPLPSKKRQLKNTKFGFGGKKRGLKRNTAESASDISGFSNKRNKSAEFSRNSNRGSSKRPGKAKRQRTH
ncbi:RRNA processing protein [Coemansia sp. RSA 1813]|nr:rRNA-processing protein EBP2 [Coemansia sp. RSA 1646]KAJ1769885.1 RRNA processing protein [Coemansia sp. RSA 1843]KAJ2088535.1 RRNA processing protein [Coemansia sp. RSA 986]KAJ2213417.1 RRNA processing protein [Coemansia sp. RSA 487]KAJ2568312.1 RRNA processing protein [Coemansia sp. RSA 1813]